MKNSSAVPPTPDISCSYVTVVWSAPKYSRTARMCARSWLASPTLSCLDLAVSLFKSIHAPLNKVACDIHGHCVCRSVDRIPRRVIQRDSQTVQHCLGLHQAGSFATEV